MSNSIGENIKYYRKIKEMKQSELAEKLQVTINTIQNYENGRREPRIDVVKQIANIFQVTLNELIEDKKTTSIGEMIAECRVAKGFSQIELGKKLGVTGAYIQQLEKGVKTNPSYLVKVNINRILESEIFDTPNTNRLSLSEYSTKELLQELLRRENEKFD